MMKINSTRALTLAAAITASAALFANKSMHKTNNAFVSEKYIKADENIRDEYVPQLNPVSMEKNSEIKQAKSVTRSEGSVKTDFDKAVEYYNTSMNYQQRYGVTRKTYDNLQTRLYNMEKAIDQAYTDCEAYGDIMIVPRWHYRFYPSFDTRLINFDLEDLRTRTTKDMESLYELKDKIEYIIEDANGKTEHTTPDKTEYDVDKLPQKH